jgi:restriction endonuclease
MKWIDSAIERLLMFVATKASGRGIVAVMAFCYGGIGLLLPIVIGASTLAFVSLNFTGAMCAFTFGLLWFAVRVERVHRRHLVEWTSDLRLLDAREFEWLVGEVFRREGWNVDEVGAHGKPDGNIDLRVSKGKDKAVVQCKRWTANLVGVDEIRRFAGTLMREGLTAKAGYFVTLSDFTEQAQAEAKQLGVVLIDGIDLYNRSEKLRRRESCPNCEAPMTLDRSIHGWWFRCTVPGCGGKRDLGSQPARAVELLTEAPE